MTIGIDIDNTITNTSIYANNLVKEYGNFNNYHELKMEDMNKFLTKYLENIVYNVSLQKNVLRVLNTWHKLGYKIIFITARGSDKTENFVNLKAVYLTSMYFKKKNIPFDEIVFFKKSKVDTALCYNVDLFIDDKENVLDEMKSKGIKTLRMTNEKNSKHQIVNNWLDIEKIVLEMGNQSWMRE